MAGAADRDFNPEIAASLALLAATVLALLLANSSAYGSYKAVLDAPVTLGPAALGLTDSVKGWVKNALMAVFFLYVGLEIKHEFTDGALSDRARATLPFVAAAGGIIVPTIIYLAFVRGHAPYLAGWAIPSATDIAFAVGVVGLLGPKVVPLALKAFLLAVAVIDDLVAILIIAVAYSGGLSFVALAVACALCAALYALSRQRHARLSTYLLLGALLWYAVLKSGINPTLAGVVTALFVPRDVGRGVRPLDSLMGKLEYPVLFAIMPLFALANAGVAFKGLSVADLTHPVTAGITFGLLVGKPLGIATAVALCLKTGIARAPDGTTNLQVLGIACLAGIGFTMSLFIGALAFGDGPLLDKVRLGVLIGSTLSAVLGVVILRAAARSGMAR